MPIATLKLRPGLATVATPALNEGGWQTGVNIRFYEGILQKSTGWETAFNEPTLGTVLALRLWEALDGTVYLGIAGSLELAVISTGPVVDITPAGFTPPSTLATLDTWGEFLMACYVGGPIYVWMPPTGPATAITQAPQSVNFMFVAIQQQILIACGASDPGSTANFDPMLLRWSTVGDYTVWTAGVDNQAGSFRLAQGSRITAGLVTTGQNLIWTDTTLYSMSYVQFPLVWGFQPLGTNCGAVGPHCVGVLGGAIFWAGTNQFWTLNASGVPEIVPCPVWDDVFPQFTGSNAVCEIDIDYGEIGWSMPQNNFGATIHVKMTMKGEWTVNTFHSFTAWAPGLSGRRAFSGHELGVGDLANTGYNAGADPLPTSAMTGDIMLAEGDEAQFVWEFYPDFKFSFLDSGDGSGSVNLTFYFYDNPTSSPRVSGPFSVTDATEVIFPRGRGKIMRVAIDSEGDFNTFWRFGNCRYRVQPDGFR